MIEKVFHGLVVDTYQFLRKILVKKKFQKTYLINFKKDLI
jgi:hypothetical protein